MSVTTGPEQDGKRNFDNPSHQQASQKNFQNFWQLHGRRRNMLPLQAEEYWIGLIHFFGQPFELHKTNIFSWLSIQDNQGEPVSQTHSPTLSLFLSLILNDFNCLHLLWPMASSFV